MVYIKKLKEIDGVNIYTYNSNSEKCKLYETSNIQDIDFLNNINVIISLNDAFLKKDLINLLNLKTTKTFIFSNKCILNEMSSILFIKSIKLETILSRVSCLNLENLNLNEIISDVNNCEDVISHNSLKNNKKSIKKSIKKLTEQTNKYKKFENICLENLYNFRQQKLPDIKKISYKESVFIDFREIKHAEVLIRNVIFNLGDGWCHTVITGNDAYNFYNELCNNIHSSIKVIKLNIDDFSHNDYNNLLLTKNFWNMFNSEKILIYQSDSFVFKNNINDFLEWDYIGAPFKKCLNIINAEHQVGNGGLSLRSKSKLINVLNNVNLLENVYSNQVNKYKIIKMLDNYPEDIVFSQNMQNLNIGKVADYDTALTFASDTVYTVDSFGMHCIWNSCSDWEKKMKCFLSLFFSKEKSHCQNAIEPIDETVETIDETVETIDEIVETIDKTVETIDKTVETIDETVETIDETVETIDETVETIDETVETIDETVETIDETVETIDETVETIDKTVKKIDETVETIDKTENYSYLKSIYDFCKIMNITECEALSNPKQEFRYFCYRHLDYIRLLNLPIITKNNYYEAVLIEFRCLPHLEFLIRNCIHKLGFEWSQTIVCGNLNYDYILKIVKNIDRDIKVIKLNYDNLTQIDYSNLLMTPFFWNLFVGEKILIHQEDSIVFKKSIMDFVEWDYIGAPWPLKYNISKNGVGNGGFSLRSKKTMLDCLEHKDDEIDVSQHVLKYMNNNKMTKIPEDVFFTNVMEKYSIGKIPDWETGKKFSSESISSDSLGGHQFWLNNKNWKDCLYSNVVKRFVETNTTDIEHRGGWSTFTEHLKTLNIYDNKSDIVFYDIVEKDFLWNKTPINKKWFGIIHCTSNTPSYLNIANISNLFSKGSHFLKNIDKCLFLIVLGPNVFDYLNNKFKELNINIDVHLLKHPIKHECVPKFSINNYIENKDKRIIQIGQQLRKMTSIYKLNIPEHKNMWLTGTRNFNKIHHLFKEECKYLNINNININDVELKYTDTFEEYDILLSKNIVFIDLFDAAANNTVLECVLRQTPLLVNKIPSTIYYLGSDYPLFFNHIDEIPNLLTMENIKKAHNYLGNVKVPTIEDFTKSLINLLNNKLTRK